MLAASDKISLAIVSRLSINDLRAGMSLPGAIYAGSHGLEIDGPAVHFRHPLADKRRPLLETLAQTLQTRLADVAGVAVRLEEAAVAVHVEHATPKDVRWLDAIIEELIDRDGRLSIVRGRHTIDVLPTRAWGRARCVSYIRDAVLRPQGSTVTTVYLGDDDAEDAFRVLGKSMLTVKIGGTPLTWAACRLPDVETTQATLAALAYIVASV